MIRDFLDSLPPHITERSKNLDLKIRSVGANTAIDDVLAKTVLRGGKRLRPLLTFLVSNLFQVELDLIAPFARASELVHAASLSHDDVIDNATMRRGTPSINIVSSNKKAVLAGDYLLSSVIVDLCATGRLDLVSEMSLVIKDLSEGEWLQLDLIASRNYSRELIREIALKKTSSVMSYCTMSSAVFAKMPQNIIEVSKNFGISLGLAFQLIDDTLDYSGESLKDQQLDLKNGIVNAVVYELLEANPSLLKRFKDGEDLASLIADQNIKPFVEIVSAEATKHLEDAYNALLVIEEYLGRSLYKDRPKELESAISHLQVIISYMSLRQN